MADIDGDGKDDICGFAEAGIFTGISNGRSAFSDPSLIKNHYTPTEGGWASYTDFPRIFGDVNGDGKDDMCAFGIDFTTCLLSNGSGFTGEMLINGLYKNEG